LAFTAGELSVAHCGVVSKPFLPTHLVNPAEGSRMMGGVDERTIASSKIVTNEVDRYDTLGCGRPPFL